MLIVRPLEGKDLPIICKLENELYLKPWLEKDFLYELNEDPFAYFMVLENQENNEIIGYYGFYIKFEIAEIAKVSIAKKYQGFHLANILMEDIEKRARLAECVNITLEVRVSNTKAYNLYQKHGYVTKTIRKHYYDNGEDAYLMIKEL